jgi:hypothetical protein
MNEINITAMPRGQFWISMQEAAKGDRIIYHIGDHCGGHHRKDATKAYQDGRALLVCKRISEGTFAYMAVKR